VEYIAKDNPRAASSLADRVFALVDRLAAGEFDGPEHRLSNGQLVRSWPVPPLRVYYQRLAKELRVLRIYHHARRPIAR
jgi:plasmid stabilization system protein ParE